MAFQDVRRNRENFILASVGVHFTKYVHFMITILFYFGYSFYVFFLVFFIMFAFGI